MMKHDIITQFKIPRRFYDVNVNAVKQEIAKENGEQWQPNTSKINQCQLKILMLKFINKKHSYLPTLLCSISSSDMFFALQPWIALQQGFWGHGGVGAFGVEGLRKGRLKQAGMRSMLAYSGFFVGQSQSFCSCFLYILKFSMTWTQTIHPKLHQTENHSV